MNKGTNLLQGQARQHRDAQVSHARFARASYSTVGLDIYSLIDRAFIFFSVPLFNNIGIVPLHLDDLALLGMTVWMLFS